MNRRTFIAACASVAVLPLHNPHALRDWLIEQLKPGALISIRGTRGSMTPAADFAAVIDLVAEVIREAPERHTTFLPYGRAKTVEDLKRTCLKQGLSAVVGPVDCGMRVADVVVELNDGCLTVLKHRYEQPGSVIRV